MIPVYAATAAELLASCTERAQTSGGPGGQHAARKCTAVELIHRASGISASCGDERDRTRNRASALHRLRIRLSLNLRGQGREADLLAQRRGRRLPLGAAAASYPAVLGYLLDVFEAEGAALAATAAGAGVSTSQLVKFFADDKEVLQAVQQRLQAAGRPPLHPP